MATFKHGDPVMVDYTAGSAITAGDVVDVGNSVFIAHSDIANGDLGALAAGGGVYEMTGDAAIAAGQKVYWDGTSKVSETGTSSEHVGVTVSACSGDGSTCNVLHQPEGAEG